MSGDVVLTAVEIGGGTFSAEEVLGWLAGLVKKLRQDSRAACGAAGWFIRATGQGTAEINPTSKLVVPNYSGSVLGFQASPELQAVIEAGVLTDAVLDALRHPEPVASAFSRALATELWTGGRARIGNFGSWRISTRPSMSRFVLFRPRAAINAML